MLSKKTFILAAILMLTLLRIASGQAQKADKVVKVGNPVVDLETTMGTIKVELFAAKAPITVKNFLAYVNTGFYNNTIIHRVDANFVIQGGGYTAELAPKPTLPPIQNESKNGLKNLKGTLSMARYTDPNSATSQFFINLNNNSNLDPTPSDAGYAVFGKVIGGMDVVEKIGAVKTAAKGVFTTLPAQTILIKTAKVVP
ncbi:MAG TPA: peptidylprolyl isomerase [Acidobacteriota bacterium]|nr:peptidylprolyl isomerase [Acidobacteriota bacterium]